MIKTNIEQVLKTIRKTHQALFTTPEFRKAAEQAGDVMQNKTINAMKHSATGHNYTQSFNLLKTMETQTSDFVGSRNGMKIGYGYIPDLNLNTKRRAQSALFAGNKNPVRLREERDMPSWVIMEYGRRGSSYKNEAVPQWIKKQISYGKRDRKNLMFGPSETRHYSKRIMFMTSKKMLESKGYSKDFHKRLKEHPGIKAGRFFREGLQDSKSQIYQILGRGIQDSIMSLTRRR